ncbi:type II toxin-antitoxin system death-on-curing family toxin [Salmonella enterica subsp. enterica serovar Emek]|uniref:Type II toxin-antitoxin system death-on-curing family toxin n=2 Tax=Gammaproteobacteria TaxID=1236 RepID=A0A754FFA3_SALER|nr:MULTISPECIES: type II toxin-antitoxin system death-on-curing family toxin [Gammaproteobacteria]EBV0095604.1 type II toxin-antitoxin system death-on-curing family toxin [Salmonella enterica subsp. enterica serovar Emek]EDW9078962.1 type II toxin-antitoxin system death-on-curing family toxin [Salmonella enterica subsp. enterica serovar Braenderup]EDY0605730.1 type II toxin-antitoxin system death-on-curing family toxin [Salmonella enterica subsp. enterica]ELZ5774015.1 type II toxin-antitoxin sy
MTDDAQPRYFYFDVTYAVITHDWIIEESGGLKGTKDIGQLESPLEHIQNDWYYPEIEDKLTHLVFSINKNHAFNDGNKRSSLALGAYFLELNGFDYIVQHFVREMENIAVWVADNVIDKELLHKIISSILYDDEYSIALKLEIYEAVLRAEENKQP